MSCNSRKRIRRHAAFIATCGSSLFLAAVCLRVNAMGAELKPSTVAGFERYVKATEARIDGELKSTARFLYIDNLPEARRSAALAALKGGGIYIERLKTTDGAGREIKADGGLIHHWAASAFVPGVTLGKVLALVQDYDRHQSIYTPEVVSSKLVSRSGDDFKIFYRLRKKKIITVTLNTDHDVHYHPVDATHCHSRSYTTRIQEVENADEAKERQKPVGRDSGFLWRLYSYWRMEQKDGGVYVNCESISLTRDTPWGLSLLIKPFVTDIPKESLEMTMGSMRRALM